MIKNKIVKISSALTVVNRKILRVIALKFNDFCTVQNTLETTSVNGFQQMLEVI